MSQHEVMAKAGMTPTIPRTNVLEHLSVTWFWSAGKCGVEIVVGD